MPSKLFDVNHQLAFYGAYHSNKINIAIHIICVPIILWTAQVFLANAGIPSFMPDVSYQINQYLAFEPNWAFIFSMIYIVYYYALEPVAAVAGALHAFSWIMQFIGHGAAEGRAPALLDNLVGAIVLAPFFVHLELLFAIGYNPSLHKRIQNEVGKQITQFRRQEADKKRAAGRKDL
ncbi:endoplasmic reticulum membrane protein [Ceratobasidium sp. AG-Ba]|nr:endoplasmic reticulum membrane protein [Ceratobasidium sp. AG-Ba]